MKFPIALQLYSVRDLLEKDLEGGLKQVKELGYDGVELAGLYDHTAAEVKEILDRVGIQAVSAHVPFTDMLEDPEGVLSDYALSLIHIFRNILGIKKNWTKFSAE